jgi:transposase
MPRPTTLPAQIVADTIIRTVELGVRIVDAALAGQATVLWCELPTDGPGRCPGCGIAGTYRDSTERRVSDVPWSGTHSSCGCGYRATSAAMTGAPG